MTLLETWRKWADVNAEGHPPYVLDADKESEAFRKLEARGRIGAYGNKREAYHDPNLKPNRLNVGLLPYPFIGDLENATIFVLMANPNAKPSDAYDGDGWDKNRHIGNLEQDFSGIELPFESLSRQPKPDGYWYSRLKRTIERIMKKKNLSHEDAIELVAKKPGRHPTVPILEHRFRRRSGKTALRPTRSRLRQEGNCSACQERQRNTYCRSASQRLESRQLSVG